MSEKPKLRKVDRFEQDRAGSALLVLRDPLSIAESFALDAEFAPVLDLLDGTRTVAQVRQSLLFGGVLEVPLDDLESFIAALSEGGWLDDDAFRERWEALHGAFLDAETREARHAGTLYPAQRGVLEDRLGLALGAAQLRVHKQSEVLGVLVPHSPLTLTGTVVDATLRDLPPADELDLVVVLGTDHSPGLLPYVGTQKAFATPLGPVDVDTATFDALERRIPWIAREEIRHRGAHSIELAAVLLRYLYGDACPPMLPLLCGQTVLSAKERTRVEHFVASLESLCEGRRVLIWGSAELGHAGPAYGRPPLDAGTSAAVERRDAACLDALTTRRHEALASRCAEANVQGRPSGGAVLTTLAQLLPAGYRAEVAAHATKKIPGRDDGLVGLAGVRFLRGTHADA